MTSPHPDDQPARDSAPVDQACARRRETLARKWAYLVSTTSYIPLPHSEIERQLLALVNRLCDAVVSEPFSTAAGVETGEWLVDHNSISKASLQRTMETLGKSLLALPELQRVSQRTERIVALLSVLASSFSEKLRFATGVQQENVNLALYKVLRDAQRNLRASEVRFDQVVAWSASGIVITDLDGRIVRTNTALEETLGYTPAEFAALNLAEIVHPKDLAALRAAYRDLVAGTTKRFQNRRRLLRKDGETAQVFIAGSLLRDADGEPSQIVTTVRDSTELSLLQNQLNRQILHDVLTGLPNRQFLIGQLERALRGADPETGVTLYHLDLDALSLTSSGLGRHVSDILLKTVAGRLKVAVAEERAMVARLDGDEFAILVENSPTTPSVATMIARINTDLAEPVYLDDHGVAASASIGVVHQPPRDMTAAELLDAAALTLRRAKRNGCRQWGLYDPPQDARDRQRFKLAAAIPGAWETGQFQVAYQPLVRLADEKIVGLRALLRWNHPERGLLPHEQCVELAEDTGMILLLRNWLVRTGCEQVRWWQQRLGTELPLSVDLTSNQSADPDLVGEVLRTLEQTGLRPEHLRLGMPARALLTDRGEAVDNLQLLVDNGIGSAIHDFGTASGDLVCLEDLPVQAVRVAGWLVERLGRPTSHDSLVAAALHDLPAAVHRAGAVVVVDGIQSWEQADWWRRAGADSAFGDHFAPAGTPEQTIVLLERDGPGD